MHELYYPPVEKEATGIRVCTKMGTFTMVYIFHAHHWSMFAFIMDNQKRTKNKNNKIITWQQENVAADTLPCSICSALSNKYSLEEIHAGLWHAWVTRLLQYVCSKNLPFSTDEVRKFCNTCQVCAEIKPQFYKKRDDILIKATNPIEQLVQIPRSPQKFNSKQVFSCSNQWVFLVSICFSMFGYGDFNFHKLFGFIICIMWYCWLCSLRSWSLTHVWRTAYLPFKSGYSKLSLSTIQFTWEWSRWVLCTNCFEINASISKNA